MNFLTNHFGQQTALNDTCGNMPGAVCMEVEV